MLEAFSTAARAGGRTCCRQSPLRLAPGGPPVDGKPGHVDGPADIHAVETVGADAVSLHVYVKPYDECDIYDLAQGVVRRVQLTYDSVPGPPRAR